MTNDAGRVSGDHDAFGEGLRDDGAGADDDVVAERNPGQNNGVRAKPAAVTQDDRLRKNVTGSIFIGVIRADDLDAGRENHFVAYDNPIERLNIASSAHGKAYCRS